MKSSYNLPLIGRCESHSCESVESGQCTREGKLYRITSETHTHVNDIPWEEYSCAEAVEINKINGFVSQECEE